MWIFDPVSDRIREANKILGTPILGLQCSYNRKMHKRDLGREILCQMVLEQVKSLWEVNQSKVYALESEFMQ